MTIYGMEEELKAADPERELEQLRIFYQIMVGCDAQNKILDRLSNDWDEVQDKDALHTWAELATTCDELYLLYNPTKVEDHPIA